MVNDPAEDAGDDGAPPRPVMGRKAFIERAVERSGLPRKADARAAVEAALAVVAEALRGGQDLQLPSLGKLRVTRTKADGRVLMVRVALPKGAGGGAGVADDDEGA